MDLREERILENEQAFAAINHRLRRDLERTGEDGDDPVAFVCECGRTACHETVLLSVGEYVENHREPGHFVVLPGHVIEDVEDVVATTERFLRVQKHAV